MERIASTIHNIHEHIQDRIRGRDLTIMTGATEIHGTYNGVRISLIEPAVDEEWNINFRETEKLFNNSQVPKHILALKFAVLVTGGRGGRVFLANQDDRLRLGDAKFTELETAYKAYLKNQT